MEVEYSEEGANLSTSRSPPRRRRSTFFERRDTLVQNDIQQHGVASDDFRREQYLQDISRYFNKLSEEKEAWKCEARERRSQYHDIKSQLKAAATGSLTTSINYSVLTNEDIEFLRGKPNVVKIAESALELKKQVTTTMHIMKRFKQLNERVLSHCEDKVDSVQKYILENSTIEPIAEPLADAVD